MAPKTEGGTKQFRWEAQHRKVLCKFMVEQAMNGMKVDKKFKTTCYRQATRKISADFGVEINSGNVPNHVRTLSGHWDDISKIIKNDSGISVDYGHGIISMDNQTAADIIKHDKCYASYINRFIESFNEMSIMFADDKATGEYAQGSPTVTTPPLQ